MKDIQNMSESEVLEIWRLLLGVAPNTPKVNLPDWRKYLTEDGEKFDCAKFSNLVQFPRRVLGQ